MPMDSKIVDPINAKQWPRRYSAPQLFGVHLVQAQPVLSISNPNYFLDCLKACESAREAKLARWELAQQLFGDLASMQRVLAALVGGVEAPYVPYTPRARPSMVQTFEEETPDDVDDLNRRSFSTTW